MIASSHTDYGALTDIVTAAGSIMAAAGAIGLAWRGRARWEPSEQDVPKGAQKVGALIAGVLIALSWATFRRAQDASDVDRLAITSVAIALVALLVYGAMIGGLTYVKKVPTGSNETTDLRIIGGFWLSREAREEKRQRKWPVQRVYAGAAYDEDYVWPRLSRQLSKSTFVLGYITLTVAGTVALALAAIRLGIAVGGSA